ncbi:MAG: D-2-hydroxyacid dehydrogenase [Verrucomicrobia bacterium]|jgi:glycerate dehydrogenase|nr:D-2-hydroxyacid dehydrogenase [Verrucomicrobiota bacterium]|tara:strand:+ start:101 stop:1054 length:954 start_codon:yes stop_codon:yes gene_type:complete
MNITVLDGHTLNPGDNPWTAVEALGNLTVYDRTPVDQIVERAKDADIILTNKCPLSREILAQLPNLKFVAVLATGYNIIDTAYCAEKGIPVSNVPIYSTDAVAEFVFSMILDFFKRPALHSTLSHEGAWESSKDFCFWQNPNFSELAGKTLGVIGFGRIGQRTAELGAAFKMNILGHSRSRSAKTSFPFEWASITEILEKSDVISLHCPLTPETHGMISESSIAKMKPTAFLVNTARGPLIDEQALADALNSDRIAGAACDVVSAEPIFPGNPLLRAKNLILTPHIAWAAYEARQRLMAITAENIRAFQSGKLIHTV